MAAVGTYIGTKKLTCKPWDNIVRQEQDLLFFKQWILSVSNTVVLPIIFRWQVFQSFIYMLYKNILCVYGSLDKLFPNSQSTVSLYKTVTFQPTAFSPKTETLKLATIYAV